MAIKRVNKGNVNGYPHAEEVFKKLNESKNANDLINIPAEMDLIQLTIRIDKISLAKLSIIAHEMGLKKSAAVRYAVNRFIKEHS